jgi:hypothetical protein
MISSSASAVIGFTLTGEPIPPSNGTLVTLEIYDYDNGDGICLDDIILSDSIGSSYDVVVEDCYLFEIFGCMDEAACNYDEESTLDDGSCFYAETNYDCDGNCTAGEDCAGECGGDAVVDECGECGGDGIDEGACDCNGNVDDCFGDCGGDAVIDECGECGGDGSLCTLQHFVEFPIETGMSSLIMIQGVEGLEVGDEIGLFDTNALTSYNDCSSEYGELLVGAGVWTGEQLNVVGTGSVDLCAFGGVQLAGYVEGNPITFKVWKAATDQEYDAVATYGMGNGVWGDILTSVSLLSPIFDVTQDVDLNALQVNLFSFNVNPEDASPASVFGNNDNILIVSNDGGQYYVPNFGVDLIGNMDVTEGYSGFLSGMNGATVSVTGVPVDLAETFVTLNALQVNLLPYLPQDCLPTEDVFSGYESNILIVKDDSGSYYVPAFGVVTLTEMCPGDGYELFLSGMDGIDFYYPSGDAVTRSLSSNAQKWSDYNEQSISTQYDIAPTGISHPIILTNLSGVVEVGDEVVAYANGLVVGATKVVDTEDMVVLSSWGGYHEYGMDLPGYVAGDQIELRLWSVSEGRELRVVADLDNFDYGTSPLSVGTAIVYNEDAVQCDFALDQNYPNPFNPTTTISYGVASTGHITLSIYDITGRLVTTLVDGEVNAGRQQAMWNGLDAMGMPVSAGVYIYSLRNETSTMNRKMVYMK